MSYFGKPAIIGNMTMRIGILHQHAKISRLRQIVFTIDDGNLNILITGAG